MKSVTTFRDLFAFPHVISNPESVMVELSGRAIRDGFVHEQTLFRQILTEHTIVNGGAYVLETVDRAVAMTQTGE